MKRPVGRTPRNRDRGLFLPALLAVLLVAGCQRESKDDLLVVTGRIFVFNYRFAYANYLITLNRSDSLPDGARVQARFDDPRGGPAFEVEQAVFPRQTKVVLESPHILCVKKDRPYAVSIEVRTAEGVLLQRLDTVVVSDVDQSILPARPLVVGPGYEPNPEIFKDGSLRPDLSERIDCPA